jgi:F0F1-type ATP synthase assembly protein I
MTDEEREKRAEPERELTEEEVEELERLIGAASAGAIDSGDELLAPEANPGAIDDEFERRLLEIEENAARIRGDNQLPEPPEWNYKRPAHTYPPRIESGSNYLGLGVGISIAYTLLGCTAAGWGIGYLIDRNTGGVAGQALGTLLGAMIGLAGAMFTITKAQKKHGGDK